MVTAAHVFDDIDGDKATISFRFKGADGKYLERPHEIDLRNAGKPLYVKHPEVDVAALYVRMPAEFQAVKMLNIGLLSKDEWLTHLKSIRAMSFSAWAFHCLPRQITDFRYCEAGKLRHIQLFRQRNTKIGFLIFGYFKETAAAQFIS